MDCFNHEKTSSNQEKRIKMNTLSTDLANRVREVFLSGTFIANSNYKAELSLVDWRQATQQIDQLNSIAALTFHINYYLDGILQAFKTGELTIQDKFSFDLPPIASASDWDGLRDKLFVHAKKFAGEIEKFEDEQWKKSFFDEKYGNYLRNIEGVLEHSYYHLGQIVLLRKLLAQR